MLAVNAIYCANSIIIPTNYGRYSLDGMADLLTAIQNQRRIYDYQFLILKFSMTKKILKTNRYINEQLKALDEHLLTTIIRKK
ncbi:hypothetical protein [Rickettsia felis]|uniref:hypothetical protein n=1 Tax=Rickettsia felis TaxID=42862 RepID=UPI001F18D882|nr:hypothetical protein [Rickettsia felis]